MVGSLSCFVTENPRDDDLSVLPAATGAEAIELLGRARPNLVLVDVVLPGMSGYEISAQLGAGDGINDPGIPTFRSSWGRRGSPGTRNQLRRSGDTPLRAPRRPRGEHDGLLFDGLLSLGEAWLQRRYGGMS